MRENVFFVFMIVIRVLYILFCERLCNFDIIMKTVLNFFIVKLGWLFENVIVWLKGWIKSFRLKEVKERGN